MRTCSAAHGSTRGTLGRGLQPRRCNAPAGRGARLCRCSRRRCAPAGWRARREDGVRTAQAGRTHGCAAA
jgi:hypothetical protein